MEERKFPKAVSNYNPRGTRDRGRPSRAREIDEDGTGNKTQTLE
jgi:hypothetical protein